ncbi:PilZ domain-containing protein [Neorhizobium sp. NCHU2750]|uniref:PilZ domain-containing protein n=1 Tax=Neorhizobium sp. NCHU2750 TaxID=1825976 RepID=UPI001FDF3EAD
MSANASSAGAQPVTPVVQAYCPQVVMLEQDAVYRVYAKGGQDDPTKLLYQASFGDMTRQCTANETTMTINVVAQGRIVQGPAGTPGPVTLPVTVDVVDGDNVITSRKVAFPVTMEAGGSQFMFSNADVQIPNAAGGASRFTRVRLGFDNGPAKGSAKPAAKKLKRG